MIEDDVFHFKTLFRENHVLFRALDKPIKLNRQRKNAENEIFFPKYLYLLQFRKLGRNSWIAIEFKIFKDTESERLYKETYVTHIEVSKSIQWNNMEFETFLIVGLFAWQSFAVARGWIVSHIKTKGFTLNFISGDLRIAGGWEAAKGAAPYQCSMQFQYTHHCGCAILDKKWIVTIASCIGS